MNTQQNDSQIINDHIPQKRTTRIIIVFIIVIIAVVLVVGVEIHYQQKIIFKEEKQELEGRIKNLEELKGQLQQQIRNQTFNVSSNVNFELYQNRKWGFEVEYPIGYTLTVFTPPQISLNSGWPGNLFVNWKNDNNALNLEIIPGSSYEGAYTYDYDCYHKGPYKITIGGVEAEKHIYEKGVTQGFCDELVDNPKDSRTSIFLIKNNLIYYISYLTNSEKEVEKIISKISFLDNN